MIITSKNNPLIKMLCQLKTPKGRNELGLFLAEGEKLTDEALNSSFTVRHIIISQDSKFDVSRYIGKANIVKVSGEVYKKISNEVTPQGIAAAVEVKTAKLSDNLAALLLDGISDPGNLGTIIRTAAAVGIDDICLYNCLCPYNPKCVRASMGGIFHVNLLPIDLFGIKNLNKPIICADLNGENLFEFKPPPSYVLAIGSEANGLSKEVKDLSKYFVKIPMTDRAESLNAAVAASIIMYDLKYKKGVKI